MGAAISTTLSEILVMLIYISLGRKKYKLNLKFKELIKIIVANLILLLFLTLVSSLKIIKIIKIITQISMGSIIYFMILIFLKEELVYGNFIQILKKRLIK